MYDGHEIVEDFSCYTYQPHCRPHGASTLIVRLQDSIRHMLVEVHYTVFEQEDIIARSAVITNNGSQELYIDKAASMQLDLFDGEYDIYSLAGAIGDEHRLSKVPLRQSKLNYCRM